MIALQGRAYSPPQGSYWAVRLALAWCAATILLSIIWPRYGFLGLGGLKATPFTFFAVASWLVLPLMMMANTSIATQIWGAILRRRLVIGLLMAWFLWRFLASLIGVDRVGSLTYLMRQVIYLLPILPLALLIVAGQNGRQRTLNLIILATAIVLTAACLELATNRSVPKLLGFEFAGDSQMLSNISELNRRPGESAIRLQSVFYHPIVFAQYLAWVAPLILHAALSKRPLWLRAAAGVCLFLTPFFIVKTDARSGLLALAGAIAVYFALNVVRRTGILSLQFLLVAVSALALLLASVNAGQTAIGGLISGRKATEAASSRFRGAMFERGLDEIKTSPVTGFGEGQSPKYAGVRGRNGILTVDSAYLSMLIDGGWIGLLLNILSWGAALVAACRVALFKRANGLDSAVAASLIAVTTVFAVLSIMDNITLIFISIAMTAGTWPPTLAAQSPRLQRPGSRDALVRSNKVT